MKKIAKMLALLLAGAMLLAMTGCTAAEAQIRKAIVDEVNAYRAESGLAPVKEDAILSAAEEAYMSVFEEKNTLTLDEDGVVEAAYKMWDVMIENNDYDEKWDMNAISAVGTAYDGQSLTLTAQYTTISALKEQVRATKAAVIDKEWDVDHQAVGISFVKVNGKTYWTCSLYAPAAQN